MVLLKADTRSPILRKALLQACLVNEVYDRQCEDSRETYLHRLIVATGGQTFFRDAFLQRLHGGVNVLEDAPQDVQLGLAQIFAILCLMAAEDDHFDRNDLHMFFDKSPRGLAELCLWSLVRLDGLSGLLRCVRRIHDDVVADYEQNGWLFGGLVETLIERDGAGIAATELQEARSEMAELNQLMVLKEAEIPARATPELINYAAFKRNLDATGRASGWRNFTDVELTMAANDLLSEREPGRIRAYLAIFRVRRFPQPVEELLPLLHHSDRQVSLRAAQALGNLKDEKVREAAISALRKGYLAQAVRLLKSNYRAGDFAIIEAKLEEAVLDDGTFHSLGGAMLDLAKNDPVAANEASALLIRLYEFGRCSLCRAHAVKLLAKENAIPNGMDHELPFDVHDYSAEIDRLGMA
jgi:hypothetical protein